MFRRLLVLFVLAFVVLPQSAMAQPRRRARAQVPAAGGARRTAHALPHAAGRPRTVAPGKARSPEKVTPRERPDSVGSPNEGRLEGGVHLDLSHAYVRVVPAYETGDVRWGLPGLIDIIDRAARGVAKKYPGAVLSVGDISRRGGGDVLRHHSHESGRDADLGFYVLDAKGKSVLGSSFAKVDETLATTSGGGRFDLPRNWLFVQLLLTDPRAHVSHIFVSEPLRQRLLGHARSIGVSQRVLDRAAIALMQPTSSLPHDDHFHVRISCPRSMRGTCVELAKGSLKPRPAIARARTVRPGRGPLRTPGVASRAPKPAPLAAGASQQPMDSPLDAADAEDTADEAGLEKISD